MECQKPRAEALREFRPKALTKEVGNLGDSDVVANNKTNMSDLVWVVNGKKEGKPKDSATKAKNRSPNETIASTGKVDRLEKNGELVAEIHIGTYLTGESPIKVGEKKLETQDSLIKVNLGSNEDKQPTYISAKLSAQQQGELIELLRKYKNCFA